MSNLLRANSQFVRSVLRLQSQSPSRQCPNCGGYQNVEAVLSSPLSQIRAFSNSPKTSTLIAAAKRVKKKKSKKTAVTEVIEVGADSIVSESTGILNRLKANDVAKCLENLHQQTSSTAKSCASSSSSPIKRMPLPFSEQPTSPSVILAMNYATSSSPFSSHSIANFSNLPSPAVATDSSVRMSPYASYNNYSINDYSLRDPVASEHQHLVPEDLLRSLSSQNNLEEESRIYINSPAVSISLPTEKDLIDSAETYYSQLSPNPLPNRIDQREEGNNENQFPDSSATNVSNAEPQKSQRSKSRKKATPTTTTSTTTGFAIWKENGRQMKKEEREQAAKVKISEMEKVGREVSVNKSLVSYLEMCVFTDQINRGFNTLQFYRNRHRESNSSPKVTDIAAYNILLHGFAAKGGTQKVKILFRSIIDDNLKPSAQSFAALFECFGRNPITKGNLHSIRQSIKYLQDSGYELSDLFNETCFEADQREVILEAIKRVQPTFVPVIKPPNMDYTCSLLTHLNEEVEDQKMVSQANGIIPLEKLKEMAKKQLQAERKGTVTIKSIEKKDDLENLDHFRNIAQETETKWASSIEEALERNMNTLFNQGMKQKSQRAISLYPFLKVLPPSDYVRIIIQEIRKLAEGSETYSPGVSQLYRELGTQVLSRYQVLYKDQKGILEKVQDLYNEYLKWYLDPGENDNECSRRSMNARQKWQALIYNPNSTGPHVDVAEKAWPNSVLSSVGRFLYGIIMRDIKINANVMKMNLKTEQMVPAFYSIFRMQGMHLKEEIKPHPALVKLFQAASRDELTFDATLVPMVCPPLPWASIRTGGYLLSPARIVRLPFQAHQQKLRLESCPREDLYPSLDSLNQLSVVPWKVNHKVLDTVIEVFNSKGDDSLNIPQPTSECPVAPSVESTMTKAEKHKIHKERAMLKRKKGEMYSLWCDALYRLSLANHFRDDVFWFPHNMDFRGRVYPCPPHLNHLGADVARAILVFAKGKALGPKGLDWLKLHLVNLTGLKKKDSVQERLDYADEQLDDILDSADYPLTGRKWWAESEEPWQTLACCIEIANAIRSGDPASYVSGYPVHQDGSCNGLQHYAALGRDQAGAESVNLAPSDYPQDVYSLVANLVEKLRQNDAQNGVEIAQVLDGFIKRKVIKQTVMTTVYGVTRYGARLQIAKQLKDIPEFPKEHLWPASLYLVGRTFDSLQEMFTSTKLIQDWFTECARQISQICGQNVEWVTPLGLPVVQPYFRSSKKSFAESSDSLRLPEVHIFDLFERPNVMKQKNAFPPNFIHSLDSSHMMLTSLHCERKGITFVSVHDCYWTHPSTVEIMNKVCREQFVALHSQPILEDLSKTLVEKYSYRESEFFKDGSLVDASRHHLNYILQDVPKKGEFDLQRVLDSVFFFS